MATHNKLAQHARQTQQQDARYIDKDERCTTVLARHIGETPNVSQTHSRPCSGQHNTHLAAKIPTLVHRNNPN